MKGKVELDSDSAARIDLGTSGITLRRLDPTLSIPNSLKEHKIGPSDYKQTIEHLNETDDYWSAGLISACFERYQVAIDSDGKFQVEVLTPGQYQLEINLNAKKDKKSGDLMGVYAGFKSKVIEVKGDTVDLGAIKMTAFQSPEIGKVVPDFKFKVGEEQSSLAALQGNHVLIDIWAEWGQRTGGDNAKLNKILERFKGSDKFTTLSIAANGTGPNKRNYPDGVKVVEGRFVSKNKSFQELGIWSMPHYILLGPNRELLFSGNVEDLKTAVEKIQ